MPSPFSPAGMNSTPALLSVRSTAESVLVRASTLPPSSRARAFSEMIARSASSWRVQPNSARAARIWRAVIMSITKPRQVLGCHYKAHIEPIKVYFEPLCWARLSGWRSPSRDSGGFVRNSLPADTSAISSSVRCGHQRQRYASSWRGKFRTGPSCRQRSPPTSRS